MGVPICSRRILVDELAFDRPDGWVPANPHSKVRTLPGRSGDPGGRLTGRRARGLHDRRRRQIGFRFLD